MKNTKKMKKKNIVKRVFERNDEEYKISFETKDGTLMVNATQMGRAFGENKKPQKFLRTKGVKAFINELKKEIKENGADMSLMSLTYIPEPFIINDNTVRPSLRGTWMHEKLALKYAAWLSPSFEFWVYNQIMELLKTGKVELDKPNMMSMQEHFNPQTQRNNSLIVAKEIYRQSKGDVASIPQYYYDLTMKLTGDTPKGWVKMGKEIGLPKSTTSKGGREVMREVSPKYTVAMSLADNILSSQKHLNVKNDLQYVVDEVKKGIPMFEGLLKLSIKLPELKGTKALF